MISQVKLNPVALQQKEWLNLFRQANINSSFQSVKFVKKLTAITLSTISYLRGMFSPQQYLDYTLDGRPIKVLKGNHSSKRAFLFTTWIKSTFPAIEKQYLRELSLEISSKDGKILEVYKISYSYEGGSASVSISQAFGNNRCQTKIYTLKEIQDSTSKMFIHLSRFIQNLLPLPNEYYIQMRISYHEEVTPQSYHPKLFSAGTPIPLDQQLKFNKVSTIKSNHHLLTFETASALNNKITEPKDQEISKNPTGLNKTRNSQSSYQTRSEIGCITDKTSQEYPVNSPEENNGHLTINESPVKKKKLFSKDFETGNLSNEKDRSICQQITDDQKISNEPVICNKQNKYQTRSKVRQMSQKQALEYFVKHSEESNNNSAISDNKFVVDSGKVDCLSNITIDQKRLNEPKKRYQTRSKTGRQITEKQSQEYSVNHSEENNKNLTISKSPERINQNIKKSFGNEIEMNNSRTERVIPDDYVNKFVGTDPRKVNSYSNDMDVVEEGDVNTESCLTLIKDKVVQMESKNHDMEIDEAVIETPHKRTIENINDNKENSVIDNDVPEDPSTQSSLPDASNDPAVADENDSSGSESEEIVNIDDSTNESKQMLNPNSIVHSFELNESPAFPSSFLSPQMIKQEVRDFSESMEDDGTELCYNNNNHYSLSDTMGVSSFDINLENIKKEISSPTELASEKMEEQSLKYHCNETRSPSPRIKLEEYQLLSISRASQHPQLGLEIEVLSQTKPYHLRKDDVSETIIVSNCICERQFLTTDLFKCIQCKKHHHLVCYGYFPGSDPPEEACCYQCYVISGQMPCADTRFIELSDGHCFFALYRQLLMHLSVDEDKKHLTLNCLMSWFDLTEEIAHDFITRLVEEKFIKVSLRHDGVYSVSKRRLQYAYSFSSYY